MASTELSHARAGRKNPPPLCAFCVRRYLSLEEAATHQGRARLAGGTLTQSASTTITPRYVSASLACRSEARQVDQVCRSPATVLSTWLSPSSSQSHAQLWRDSAWTGSMRWRDGHTPPYTHRALIGTGCWAAGTAAARESMRVRVCGVCDRHIDISCHRDIVLWSCGPGPG